MGSSLLKGSEMAGRKVKMYTLSTCSHCKAAKRFMVDHGIDFDYTDVDLLDGAERMRAIREVRAYNPACTFPTILIGDEVMVGNDESRLTEALGLREAGGGMTAEGLYEMLRKTQEPKGYHFSDDRAHVLDLLRALIKNKERYGYTCCPCRLAADDPE